MYILNGCCIIGSVGCETSNTVQAAGMPCAMRLTPQRLSTFRGNKMSEKVVNYTVTQTAHAIAEYQNSPTAETVATLAESFGKSIKSVIAYLKAERKTKSGNPVVTKEAFVSKIAGVLGVNDEKMDGLEKAPKAALEMILNALETKNRQIARIEDETS